MKKIATTINGQKAKSLLAMAFIMMVSIAPALAQLDGFDDPGIGDVPIDGGLSLLVAAGVGYAAKKMRNKKRQQSPAPHSEA